MRLDAKAWRRKRGVARILKALDADKGVTRYVGGAVRDELMGLAVSDIDFATRLHPHEVIDRLEARHIKAVPTGIEHGTITAVADGQPAEVTTLRADVSTDGRRATVAFTDDWMADASRRDFTINALYADPIDGEIHDYFGGLEDLKARRVRFIGDPLIRIAEDHLRILRFFRFHARFGQREPDPQSLAACAARANDLMALSRERIADELIKLLAMEDPAPTVSLMAGNGIFRPVLPEIGEEGVARLRELIRHERACAVQPQPIRRLAALLGPDPELGASVAARLRLSKKAAKRLVSAADRSGGGAEPTTLAYTIGTDEAVDRLLLAGEEPAGIGDWPVPRLPLSGGELIGMGLTAGPEVARVLQAVERAWVEAGFPDRAAAHAIARAKVEEALAGR